MIYFATRIIDILDYDSIVFTTHFFALQIQSLFSYSINVAAAVGLKSMKKSPRRLSAKIIEHK